MTTFTVAVPTPAPATTIRRLWTRRPAVVAIEEPEVVEFTWANRRPGTPGFARWAAAATRRVAARGVADASRDVENLLGVARNAGIRPDAVDVLADAAAPETDRRRAFDTLAAALGAPC